MWKSIPKSNDLSLYLKYNIVTYSFSHPLLNPCAVKTIIMVVISKLVVMHICSDWWVMVGGFRGEGPGRGEVLEGSEVCSSCGRMGGWMLFS